jgi:hypothetical protein
MVVGADVAAAAVAEVPDLRSRRSRMAPLRATMTI